MSYSVSLASFATPAVNGQPKSFDRSIRANKVNGRAGNKRTCNDDSKNPLASHLNGECQAERRKQCKTIESTEMTHLFCGASIHQAVKSDGYEGNSQDTESASDHFRHYSIDPMCMTIRVCIFWFLWVMLIVAIVISILSYCCLPSKTCCNSTIQRMVNTTNT